MTIVVNNPEVFFTWIIGKDQIDVKHSLSLFLDEINKNRSKKPLQGFERKHRYKT